MMKDDISRRKGGNGSEKGIKWRFWKKLKLEEKESF